MLELKAKPFVMSCEFIGQMTSQTMKYAPDLPGKYQSPIDTYEHHFGEFRAQLESLGQALSVNSLDRIRDLMSKPLLDDKAMERLINELRQRFLESLDGERFYVVETKDRSFFDLPQPIFGGSLDDDPDSLEDAVEAGKCIALGRYTASVFHLMRLLERFVRALADRIGATVKDTNGQFLAWGQLLSNIRGGIDKMQKGQSREHWSQAHALLVSVNIAWRTTTMHPKQTYTEEHARDIFNATRAFVRYLAPLL